LQLKRISIYPVRKPQHLRWGWWKYLQKQEHQLLIEGGVKALPFLTGFTTDKHFEQAGFDILMKT
jgi:hypothetical protein